MESLALRRPHRPLQCSQQKSGTEAGQTPGHGLAAEARLPGPSPRERGVAGTTPGHPRAQPACSQAPLQPPPQPPKPETQTQQLQGQEFNPILYNMPRHPQVELPRTTGDISQQRWTLLIPWCFNTLTQGFVDAAHPHGMVSRERRPGGTARYQHRPSGSRSAGCAPGDPAWRLINYYA